MSNSTLFKTAHKITKKTIQAGDDYRVTFGAWLKVLFANQKTVANFDIQSLATTTQEILSSADFQAFAQAKINIVTAKLMTINFNAFLNAEIDAYSASKFESAIAGIKMFDELGRKQDVQSSVREALSGLALDVLNTKKLWDL